MTTEELTQLAITHEQTNLSNNDWDEGGGYRHDAIHDTFEAGFKKALELVANMIVESPTVNKEFQQTFVKEFFYFI